MKVRRIATQFGYSIVGVLALACSFASPALAQDDHSHLQAPQSREESPEQRVKRSALVNDIREATKNFQTQPPEGYGLMFGCVSGGDFGAMGMHFLNGALLDSEIKKETPEILLYEPLPDGRIRLTGVDYVVTKEAWESNPDHKAPPELDGQLFHLFESPNRFNLPDFYTLHVWAWKTNPNGTFTNWNPNVSCDAFAGEK
jgi:hypothetical protein